ncbi:MAG: DNA-directed RNA polymerase subunit beta [Microbacteriaceae bacterium]
MTERADSASQPGESGQLRPVKRSSGTFDSFEGGDDPALHSRIAHDSAHALLNRVRQAGDPKLVARVTEFADEYGIDTVAELWAHAAAKSLPGALWRVYVLRSLIVQQPDSTAFAYERGHQLSTGIDPVVAGAATPTGPDEIRAVADQILQGVFAGDFGVALDRAAAFARVCSVGCIDLAHDAEPSEPQRASELTARASRLALIAEELTSCARLWRHGLLD